MKFIKYYGSKTKKTSLSEIFFKKIIQLTEKSYLGSSNLYSLVAKPMKNSDAAMRSNSNFTLSVFNLFSVPSSSFLDISGLN